MLVEIVPELFMKNLRAIPSKKQVNHLKRLKEISSGAAYLYKAVILPKTQGKEVYTGKVNMTAFDRTDIETVCDYYKDNLLSIFNTRNGGMAIYGGVIFLSCIQKYRVRRRSIHIRTLSKGVVLCLIAI